MLNTLASILDVFVTVVDSVASLIVVQNPVGVLFLADLAVSQAEGSKTYVE